jgi:hypothetical protein
VNGRAKEKVGISFEGLICVAHRELTATSGRAAFSSGGHSGRF